MTFDRMPDFRAFDAIAPAEIVVLVRDMMPVPVIERDRLLAVPADAAVVLKYLCAALALINSVEQIVAVVAPVAALVLELTLVGRTAIPAEATHAPACFLRRLENF